MTVRILISLLLASASLSACAQSDVPKVAAMPAATVASKTVPGTPDARARAAVDALGPQLKIEHVGAAPLPGFREVIVGGQVLYISDDGKYMMQGTLIDLGTQTNLAEVSMAKLRRDLIKSIPVADRIVFAPANPKYKVVVFTDIECGYCRKLHSEIAQYNQQGIAVEYLAFPRMGLASDDFKKMEAVWCSPDRRKALTDAKNDRAVAASRCTSPVAMEYAIGQRAGLTGTPMILSEDGRQLGGYLPPAELRAALDKLAVEQAAKAGPERASSGS